MERGPFPEDILKFGALGVKVFSDLGQAGFQGIGALNARGPRPKTRRFCGNPETPIPLT